MEKDIYVVVAENNEPHRIGGKMWVDDNGPLVMEQYTKDASLENMVKKAAKLEGSYGTCRVAKLVFVEL